MLRQSRSMPGSQRCSTSDSCNTRLVPSKRFIPDDYRPKIQLMAAGIYIHIPFCRSRCSYCDFATDIYRDAAWVERYVRALVREIDMFHYVPPCSTNGGTEYGTAARPEVVDTIYLGGGTPSLLSAKQ